jgi:hypothetical protein
MSIVSVVTAIEALRPHRFWLLWFIGTAGSMLYIGGAVSCVARPIEKTSGGSGAAGALRSSSSLRHPILIIALITFLASYLAIMLSWESFADYDNDLLIVYQLAGRDFPLPIWLNNGRFFPFAMQEFNLVRHFTNSVVGYHLIPIVQASIVLGILLVLDVELSVKARVGLAIIALLTPSVLLSFEGLIYEERDVLFFLMLILMCSLRFERSRGIFWAFAALISAQLMLYFKETAFLLLIGFSAIQLISRRRVQRSVGWDTTTVWYHDGSLEICFFALALLFLFSYFAMMGINGNLSYATQAHHRLAEVLTDYLHLDLLVWLFVPVILTRAYLIIRHKAAPWLLWDGLAVGGLGYLLAYLYLGMFTAYYLAPVDVIAVLYVGRFILLSWNGLRPWPRVVVIALASVVVFQDVSFSAFTAFERKNVIHAKVEMANFLVARYHASKAKIPRLFFPFADPYIIMEYVIYLNYRGLPISDVTSVKRGIATDNRCIAYRSVRCLPATEPAAGDLVIVLPDDEVPLLDTAVYRHRGRLLFFYQPYPRVSYWLYSLVGNFPLNSGGFDRTRPDRWLDASITAW